MIQEESFDQGYMEGWTDALEWIKNKKEGKKDDE